MSRTRKGSKGVGWEPWSNLRERQEQKADYREPEESTMQNNYKPLKDEELTRDEAYVISLRDRGSPYSFKSQYGVLQLLEQARRANALAEVVQTIAHGLDETCGKFPELEEVLAAYLGETND